MNAQLDLGFDVTAHARRSASETSHAAARSMRKAAPTLMARILADLKSHGPATQTEIAKRMGLDRYAVNKRLPDLRHAGQIEDSGERRAGKSGRLQAVWRAR